MPPTLYDLLGIKAPKSVNGFKQDPMDGVSLVPAFKGQTIARSKPLFFQFGKEAVVHTVMANLRLHLAKKLGQIPEFGHGGHFCLGANLARVEIEKAFPDLIVRESEGAALSGGIEQKLMAGTGKLTVEGNLSRNRTMVDCNRHVCEMFGASREVLKRMKRGSSGDFFLKLLEQMRRTIPETPPDYDAGKSRYPVLYLLHGWGENEQGWHTQGHADLILDNLIAVKKAVPMIIVMPNGRAQKNDRAEGDVFAAAPAFATFERDLPGMTVEFMQLLQDMLGDLEGNPTRAADID